MCLCHSPRSRSTNKVNLLCWLLMQGLMIDLNYNQCMFRSRRLETLHIANLPELLPLNASEVTHWTCLIKDKASAMDLVFQNSITHICTFAMGHRNFYFWHLLGCEMFQENLEALVEHDFFVCFSNPAKRVAKYFSQPKADSKALELETRTVRQED